MALSRYLCLIAGEPHERSAGLHPTSIRRLKAFAIAIHIPVMMWGATSYIIASRIFHLEAARALATAMFCAALIYLVERIVLVTPKKWYVTAGRLMLGCVIAVLGASTVDLVIFEREVARQMKSDRQARLEAGHDGLIASRRADEREKKAAWLAAQAAASCEANGTCGSRVRSTGPIYRELARHAAVLQAQHAEALAALDKAIAERARILAEWDAAGDPLADAGLLARIEALHQYTLANPAARVAWLLFFTLVLFFELMVVLAKLVFGHTVDDELDQIREAISHHRAHAYLEAVTSPVAGARQLLESSYC